MKNKEASRITTAFLIFYCLSFFIYYSTCAFQQYEKIYGYESEWIATSIAKGHGFSLDGAHRWLFESANSGEYYLTAWQDPVFPYIYALLIWLFGPKARLAALILNSAGMVGIAVLIYFISQKLYGRYYGIGAMAALGLHGSYHGNVLQINNSILAGLMIIALAACLVCYLDHSINTHLYWLGILLGFTILTCSITILFLPAFAILLLFYSRDRLNLALFRVAILIGICILPVSAWTLRNYMAFSRIIPVRTGFGQISHIGSVCIGETIAAEIVPDKETSVPYSSRGYRDAVQKTLLSENRRSLERYQMGLLKAIDPDYRLNEADRDAWLKEVAFDYILKNPLMMIKLAIIKIGCFFQLSGGMGLAYILMAGVGFMAGIFNKNILSLGLISICYLAPFTIIIPYFERYRIPLEALMIVLAMSAIKLTVSVLSNTVKSHTAAVLK